MVSAITTRQLFKTADADKNNALGLAEFKKLAGDVNAPSQVTTALKSADAAQAFASFDTDKSGSLTRTELQTGLNALVPDTAGALLAAQEKLNPAAAQTAESNRGLFASLFANLQGSTSSILAAYAAGNKL